MEFGIWWYIILTVTETPRLTEMFDVSPYKNESQDEVVPLWLTHRLAGPNLWAVSASCIFLIVYFNF